MAERDPFADGLSPSALLVRVREIDVRLSDDDEIAISFDGERVTAPRIALAVLDAFAHARAVADVLDELGGRGPEAFIEASSAILQLARAGVLVAPGARKPVRLRGFVRPAIHIAMLEDVARTRAFGDALRAIVAPSDVVVDIGTGTGVLAASAAKAGARRVFAVESTGIAEVAERVFAENDLTSRVELVRGRSTHVTLPERGTVLVTETIGNDPLDEHLLEIVADAKRRLLEAGARIIPAKLEVLALLVDIPSTFFDKHVFTNERLVDWSSRYGVSFESLAEHTLSAAQPIPVKTHELTAWPLVAPPTSLFTIDLEASFEPVVDAQVTVPIARDTSRLGVALAFRATLARGERDIVVSSVPGEVDAKNAWRYALWPATTLARVAGESVSVDYRYERGVSELRFV